MNDEVCPSQRPRIELRRLGGAYELTGPRGEPVCQLNETALALWELCDGGTAVREMADAVAELFGLDADEARAEVQRTLEQLVAVGAVEDRAQPA